jgi:hypothetical protein
VSWIVSALCGAATASVIFVLSEIARLVGKTYWWRSGLLRGLLASQLALILASAISYTAVFSQPIWEPAGQWWQASEALASIALDLFWWWKARRGASPHAAHPE